jgi:hypothetical protein
MCWRIIELSGAADAIRTQTNIHLCKMGDFHGGDFEEWCLLG